MKIHLANDERAVFVGTTGSGKTVLAKHFLRRINRAFVIDPKHTFRLDGFSVRRGLPLTGKRFKIVYRPRLDDDERLAGMLYNLNKQKHATIYCDELATLSEQFPVSTTVLADIARTGRERYVSVWTALQRPRWVPRVFFTEAEAVFLFNLRGFDDRAYMTNFVGPEAADGIEQFTFWYSHVRENVISLLRLNLNKNYIEKIG